MLINSFVISFQQVSINVAKSSEVYDETVDAEAGFSEGAFA